MDRLLEVVTAVEVMVLQDVLNPAAEAFDRAIGLWVHRRSQAMLDIEAGAEAIEVVVASGGSPSQAEKPAGDGLNKDAAKVWKQPISDICGSRIMSSRARRADGLSRCAALAPVAGVCRSFHRFSMWPGFLG